MIKRGAVIAGSALLAAASTVVVSLRRTAQRLPETPLAGRLPVDTSVGAALDRSLAGAAQSLDSAASALDPPADRRADYEERTVAELMEEARERDISGRSGMRKAELIDALVADDRSRRNR